MADVWGIEGRHAIDVDSLPTGDVAATTLQAAIAELASEKQPLSARAQPNGYASLDSAGRVPVAQIPASALNASETLETFAGNDILTDFGLAVLPTGNLRVYRDGILVGENGTMGYSRPTGQIVRIQPAPPSGEALSVYYTPA